MRPRVVMTGTDRKVHVIREREQLQTLNALEMLPEHLKEFEL
jgi:hypothetical protein